MRPTDEVATVGHGAILIATGGMGSPLIGRI
jgi:hypothetical protein